MGATPTDTTLMTASSTTYAPGDSVTVTLNGLSSGAFVHTSAGTPATISGFTAKMCTGTSLQYKASSVSSTETLTWTAPSDLTGLATVEISAGTASGYGQIKRHTLTLTRAAAVACAANERVSAGACVACAAGTTRAAGDDPYAGDTTCAANTCAANERVSGNACVACAAGTTNAAGDDASGSDTTCAAMTVVIVEDEAADEDDAEAADEDEDDGGSVLEISSDGASSASTRVVPAAAAALAGAVGFCLYQ